MPAYSVISVQVKCFELIKYSEDSHFKIVKIMLWWIKIFSSREVFHSFGAEPVRVKFSQITGKSRGSV